MYPTRSLEKTEKTLLEYTGKANMVHGNSINALYANKIFFLDIHEVKQISMEFNVTKKKDRENTHLFEGKL